MRQHAHTIAEANKTKLTPIPITIALTTPWLLVSEFVTKNTNVRRSDHAQLHAVAKYFNNDDLDVVPDQQSLICLP